MDERGICSDTTKKSEAKTRLQVNYTAKLNVQAN